MITEKKCVKCRIIKPVKEFHTTKYNTTGTRNDCKTCNNRATRENARKWYRTFTGRIVSQYTTMRKRSLNTTIRRYKFIKIEDLCDREKFIEWLMTSSTWKTLYDNWITSNCELKLAPSIDRVDNKKGYSFDNIQIITQSENSKEAITEETIIDL